MSHNKAPGVPPAISCPETKAAARRGAVGRWSLMLIGLVCLPLTVVLIDVGDRIESATLSRLVDFVRNLAAGGMTVGLIVGGVLIWINRRRRRAIRRYPWIVWRINYIATGRYEWVELLDRNGHVVSGLILSTWSKDIGKLVDRNTSEIWFAGDPAKYGVISRPGGSDLRYAYVSKLQPPPRWTFRTEEPKGDIGMGVPMTGVPKYELARESGQLMMKPVGEPGATPARHGAKGDSRYPSPRMVRRVSAFAFDWVLHLGIGLGAAIALSPEFSFEAATRFDWKHLGVSPVIALGCWLLTSAVDRVLVQAVFHTTVGKALFGLVIIRPGDGTYPSFGRLLAVWLVNVYLVVAIPIDGPGPDSIEDYFLPAVRRRDLQRDRAIQ
ncbi:RDD family protein [Nocardia sp. CA-119907]|uniref:RDD family protein n=1 Tax=Nocardia sp. CA-119907 TaxID=3239973 RepID=UPI003D965089